MAKIVELPRATTLTVVDAHAIMGDTPPPVVDPETGLPGALQAYVVSADPKMTVIPHFFSDEECDHLTQMVEGCWMPSLVGGASYVAGKQADIKEQGDVANSVSQTRTSWSCMLRYAQTNVIERLEHRIASIAGLPDGVKQMERMNMVRYAPGELFNEHHDGKFRPKTIFVYLNEMAEDDDRGDTFFPVLGYSFKPRKGTAVMWMNATEDGQKEDSRMVHAGRAPKSGVKYGVNCFTNERCMRELVCPTHSLPEDRAVISRIAELVDEDCPLGDDGKPILRAYQVVPDPQVKAIPGLLSAEEIEHFLERANGVTLQPTGPFREGSQTIAQLPFADTSIVEAVELRLCSVTGEPLDNLAMLRLVRPGKQEGLCNRGCGKYSAYVCLCKEEELYFPRLGIRFVLTAGDALSWTNVNFSTGACQEDMRTVRLHRSTGNGPEQLIGIDAYFHDNPLRAQQKVRAFVSDTDILNK